jgi:hypothetical protein
MMMMLSNPDPKIFENDAQQLRECLKGKQDKEEGIINITLKYTKRDRQGLKEMYKTCFGRDLQEDLAKELGGNFKETMVALYDSPPVYDAKCLYKAMKGLGTDEDTLIEIICTRPNFVLKQIKEEFKKLYNKELEKWVEKETSGDLKKILISLLQCNRSENPRPNEEECKKTAEEIFKNGEGRLGTDETLFRKVFAISSPAELYSINKHYIDLTTRGLKAAVEKEFSGDIKKALQTILDGIICPSEYFANRVNKAVKGLGTNDKMLVRVLVSREEIDIPQMRIHYKTIGNKEMVDDVVDDTSGMYQKILKSICEKNY